MNTKKYNYIKHQIDKEYKRYDEVSTNFISELESLHELIKSNNIIIGYCEEMVDMLQKSAIPNTEIIELYLRQLDLLRSSNDEATIAIEYDKVLEEIKTKDLKN